jgi:hypothetical protein
LAFALALPFATLVNACERSSATSSATADGDFVKRAELVMTNTAATAVATSVEMWRLRMTRLLEMPFP